jgi:hypothetical protein
MKLASLFLATMILSGSGCPLIPDIEEKVVELAVGASVIVPFEARGIINDKGEVSCFAVDDEIDLRQILDDADVNVSDVKAISLSGVSYRVSKADANASRMIVNSSVDISYGDDGPDPLVTGFSGSAGAVTDFMTVSLDAAGVTLVNSMLEDLLVAVQNNTDSNVDGCATWTGQSTPIDENTNFDWEIRLDITIVGEITIDVPN